MFSSNQWRFRQSVRAFAAISVCRLGFFIGHSVASAVPVRELEGKCWSEIVTRLEPAHRADVLRLLGKPPVKLTSSFHLLIESLSRLENRKANAK